MTRQIHSDKKSDANLRSQSLHPGPDQQVTQLRHSWSWSSGEDQSQNLLFKAAPMRRGEALAEASLKSSLRALAPVLLDGRGITLSCPGSNLAVGLASRISRMGYVLKVSPLMPVSGGAVSSFGRGWR